MCDGVVQNIVWLLWTLHAGRRTGCSLVVLYRLCLGDDRPLASHGWYSITLFILHIHTYIHTYIHTFIHIYIQCYRELFVLRVYCTYLSLVSTSRVDGPSWRVTRFHYPSTSPVLTGNGNRSPVNSGSGNRALRTYFHMCYECFVKLLFIAVLSEMHEHATRVSSVVKRRHKDSIIVWCIRGLIVCLQTDLFVIMRY